MAILTTLPLDASAVGSRFSIMKLLAVLARFTACVLFGISSAENFTQPVLWQDLADTDLIRVGDAFYYSASTMHFSPGAPILRSYDLVNWEYFSHSVPSLNFSNPAFDLQGGNEYNAGIYASTLRYRNSTETFYWIGCIQGTGKTYIYTAPGIAGPWKQTSVISNYCYYDCGLLVDDDDSMYVSYGLWVADGSKAKIWVAQLTPDGLQNKKIEIVWNTTSAVGYVEGTRFYKKGGIYYILLTNPGVGSGEIILKSTQGPFGPYSDWHRVLQNNGNPVPSAGSPYQGALVDTPAGDWWYVAFVNRYPGGRIPVLAPVTWDADGWPNVIFNGKQWGSTYPYPLPKHPVKSITGTDNFNGTALGPQYEWNHNPDNSKWSIGKGLTLQTATTTDDFFMARNTLSHRMLGPKSSCTIRLDYSSMVDGDRAGLAVFRYDAAWIAVAKNGSSTTVQMVDHLLMANTNGWKTQNKGAVVASESISGGIVWLRIDADISTGSSTAKFSYSADGSTFTNLGQTHTMADGAVYFVGDRYGIFNMATKSLGGKVIVDSFTISQ